MSDVPHASPATVVRERPPQRRPVRRFALGTIALAALVLGGNAYWFWRDTRPLVPLGHVSEWIRDRRWEEAEKALGERLRRHPHDGEARILLATVRNARGDPAGCARELLSVPEWSTRKAETLLRAGESLLAADRAREAEETLLAVLNRNAHHAASRPHFREACEDLLRLYATEDRLTDAYGVIWRAYDAEAPVDRLRWVRLRMEAIGERRPDLDHREALRRYLAADPSDAEALRALARAESARGRSREAIELMRSCLSLRPADPAAWRDDLAILWEAGERDAFRDAVSRIPKAAENDHEILAFRARAREAADDWAGAAESYRAALEQDPFVPDDLERLAGVEDRLGEAGKADEHRRRAAQLRAARDELNAAYSDYRKLPETTPGADPAALSRTIRRMIVASDTLGLSRLAAAWREQLPIPEASPGS